MNPKILPSRTCLTLLCLEHLLDQDLEIIDIVSKRGPRNPKDAQKFRSTSILLLVAGALIQNVGLV